jgi:hypothetical protein
MGGRKQKEHFPFGSILEERIVRLGLIPQPVSVILPRFENSRNVEMTTLSSSVPRYSFLREKPDLSFVWLRRRHELADRIEHDLELSVVSFFERCQLASQVLVSCDHLPQANEGPLCSLESPVHY